MTYSGSRDYASITGYCKGCGVYGDDKHRIGCPEQKPRILTDTSGEPLQWKDSGKTECFDATPEKKKLKVEIDGNNKCHIVPVDKPEPPAERPQYLNGRIQRVKERWSDVIAGEREGVEYIEKLEANQWGKIEAPSGKPDSIKKWFNGNPSWGEHIRGAVEYINGLEMVAEQSAIVIKTMRKEIAELEANQRQPVEPVSGRPAVIGEWIRDTERAKGNLSRAEFPLQDGALAYIERLEVRAKHDDEGVDEFNAGFDAYNQGKVLDDEPSEFRHDQWRIGWAWAQFNKQEEAERKSQSND